MIDLLSASSPAPRRALCTLAMLTSVVLGASEASALPQVQIAPRPGFLLAQAAKPAEPTVKPAEQRRVDQQAQAPLTELNEVLEATRARLDELFGATHKPGRTTAARASCSGRKTSAWPVSSNGSTGALPISRVRTSVPRPRSPTSPTPTMWRTRTWLAWAMSWPGRAGRTPSSRRALPTRTARAKRRRLRSRKPGSRCSKPSSVPGRKLSA